MMIYLFFDCLDFCHYLNLEPNLTFSTTPSSHNHTQQSSSILYLARPMEDPNPSHSGDTTDDEENIVEVKASS